MNNTFFSQTERIQLLENMMNEQAKQINEQAKQINEQAKQMNEQAKQISKLVETQSGFYFFFNNFNILAT